VVGFVVCTVGWRVCRFSFKVERCGFWVLSVLWCVVWFIWLIESLDVRLESILELNGSNSKPLIFFWVCVCPVVLHKWLG